MGYGGYLMSTEIYTKIVFKGKLVREGSYEHPQYFIDRDLVTSPLWDLNGKKVKITIETIGEEDDD
jgi:hypothetical protein